GFTVDNLSTTSIAAHGSLAVTLHFDPTHTGDATDTLQIVSNSILGSKISIPLFGHGISASGAISLDIPNDNAGGAKLGTVKSVAKFGTILNDGATDLTITGVQTGTSDFTVTGLPGGSFVLAPGQSRSFGIQFDPSQIGLIR